jgi:hypothetical protein
MSISLTARLPEVKARSGEAALCPRCRGSGTQPGTRTADPGPCDLCETTGVIIYAPRREPEPSYLVTVADGLVETGNEIAGLVRQLCREWGKSLDDLAVWEDRGDDGQRLVALIRPGPRGLSVTYL